MSGRAAGSAILELARGRGLVPLPALMLGLCLALSGCTVNPATGQQSFTVFMSPEREVEVGREEHPKIVRKFGGVYGDPEVARYVSSVGELLARTSELPNLRFTFTVLNTPIVNAFAIPGGYVYITRGLLALADNEAELAGVLAHEIGHVAARHSAQRYSQAMAANIGLIFLGVLAKTPELNRIAGLGVNLYLSSYSREQEFEADKLSLRYLNRAGFSGAALAAFLGKLQAHDALQAHLTGKEGMDPSMSLLATHPRTAERLYRAMEASRVVPIADPIIGRTIYLKKIDGLLYGDVPSQGFIKGRLFVHPELGFRFQVPPGFRLFNSAKAVVARNGRGARIIFDGVPRRTGEPMLHYLTARWGGDLFLRHTEAIVVNGMEAATGHTQVHTSEGILDLRLLAIAFKPRQIYRFIFLSPPAATAALSLDFRSTTYSFRALSRREAAGVKPLRVVIVTVQAGDTVENLAANMPFEDYRLERFRVLNGLAPGQGLIPGQHVKLIAG